MSNVIEFPKPQVVDITTWPLTHVKQYCKDNGWTGFVMRRHGKGKIEIRRTYGSQLAINRLREKQSGVYVLKL